MENTFCKILPDIAGKDKYCIVCSADGVGTKAHYVAQSLSNHYILGMVHDAIVMNLDDLLCVGATKNFYMTNTISIGESIDLREDKINHIRKSVDVVCGMYKIQNGGGETAILNTIDTLLFDVSMFTRMNRKKLISVNLDDSFDEIVCVGIKLSETSWGCNGFTELRKVKGISFSDLETTYSHLHFMKWVYRNLDIRYGG